MSNPNPARYKILRQCLWFAKGDLIDVDLFQSYYTMKSVKSLLEYGYIQIHLQS